MSVTIASSLPTRPLPGPQVMIAVIGLALTSGWAGLPLSGPVGTMAASLAILVFGLPHGTLDLELIRARLSGPWTGMVTLVTLYHGLAALMLAVWQIAPVLALGVFIAIAVVHFSEDWDGTSHSVLRASMALSLLAAPTVLHRADLDAIFVALSDRVDATAVSGLLSLVAPIAMVGACLAVFMLWRGGSLDQAIGGAAALAGLLFLPPVVGFAAYFCFFHSPRHFRHSLDGLGWRGLSKWGWVVMPLTLAAGLLAAMLYGLEVRLALSDQIMAASFMTLSVLTVPHMLVPILVDRLVPRRAVMAAPTRSA
jgi:Brp/Blh family beta-carotene 15,15'-monooxygenase